MRKILGYACLLGIVIVSILGIRYAGGVLAILSGILFFQRKEKPVPRREVDLEQFFSEGGYAWYWNVNGKRQKCTKYDDFLKIKADYCELWLDGERFVFKEQG